MIEVRTHRSIDSRLVGVVDQVDEGSATVRLATVPEMAADDRGLVHGGFVFGAADYAAMVAVNDPNVVLASSDLRFRAPVRVGDVVVATARVASENGRKREVAVEARVGEVVVLTGMLVAAVLERHVFDREETRG
jgi:acyl-coenzyme A thioesterase PaaI-like protein